MEGEKKLSGGEEKRDARKEPEEFHKVMGEIANKILASAEKQKKKRSEQLPDAKKLTKSRRELLDRGSYPMESFEGSNVCFRYILDKILDDEAGYSESTQPSRSLKLEDYKEPDQSETASIELRLATTVDVASYLIESIRKTYKEGGKKLVEEQFPGLISSNQEMTRINIISQGRLADYCKTYFDDESSKEIPDSVKRIIKYCNLEGEYVGSIETCPYKPSGDFDPNYQKDYGDKRSNGNYRIYLNTPNSKADLDFLSTYAKKCIDRRVPFYLKNKPDETAKSGRHTDGTILYIPNQFLDSALEIMDEIEDEKPEVVAKFGTPPITAEQFSYYCVSQSRRDASWNMIYDRVATTAFTKTILEYMRDNNLCSEEQLKDAEKRCARIASLENHSEIEPRLLHQVALPDWAVEFVKSSGKTLDRYSMRERFFLNMREVFSLANFGDRDHKEYPFCFSDTFYSEKENKKR